MQNVNSFESKTTTSLYLHIFIVMIFKWEALLWSDFPVFSWFGSRKLICVKFSLKFAYSHILFVLVHLNKWSTFAPFKWPLNERYLGTCFIGDVRVDVCVWGGVVPALLIYRGSDCEFLITSTWSGVGWSRRGGDPCHLFLFYEWIISLHHVKYFKLQARWHFSAQ